MAPITHARRAIALAVLPTVLCSCDERRTEVGQFIDSPVQGLQVNALGRPELTDEGGRFSFVPGGLVSFSVGGIQLGQAFAKSVMTPMDLVGGAFDENDPRVTNIAMFLQSIDASGTPSDGITITQAARDALADLELDFNQPPQIFRTSVQFRAVLDAVGVGDPVTISDARDHLRRGLLSTFAGEYAGSYSGEDQGLVQLFVGSDGAVTALFTSAAQTLDISLEGELSARGEVLAEGLQQSLAVSGVILNGQGVGGGSVLDEDGDPVGSWQVERRVPGTVNLREIGAYSQFSFIAQTSIPNSSLLGLGNDSETELTMFVSFGLDGAPSFRITSFDGIDSVGSVVVTSLGPERGTLVAASPLGLLIEGEIGTRGVFEGVVSDLTTGELLTTFSGGAALP